MAGITFAYKGGAGGGSVYDGRQITITNTDTTTNINTTPVVVFAELFGVAGAYDAGLFAPNFALATITVLEAGLFSISGYASFFRVSGTRLTIALDVTLNGTPVSPQFRDNYLRGLGGADFSGQAIPYFTAQLAINDVIGIRRLAIGGGGTANLDTTRNYVRMTKIL